MEKKIIIDFLELLKQRIANNECTEEELENCKKIFMDSINPKLTRKEAIDHFKVTDRAFDTKVSKRMSAGKKIRNIVTYPYNELLKLFS